MPVADDRRTIYKAALILATIAVAAAVLDSPPDLDNSDVWDVALDDFDDTAPPVVAHTERPAFGIVGSID